MQIVLLAFLSPKLGDARLAVISLISHDFCVLSSGRRQSIQIDF